MGCIACLTCKKSSSENDSSPNTNSSCNCCYSSPRRNVKKGPVFTERVLWLETVDAIAIGEIKYPPDYSTISSTFLADNYISRIVEAKNEKSDSSHEARIYDKNEKKVYYMDKNGCCSSVGVDSNSTLLTNIYDESNKSMAYRVTKETSCCESCKDEIPIRIIKSSDQHLMGIIPLIQAAVFYTLPPLKIDFRAPSYYKSLRDLLNRKEHTVNEWLPLNFEGAQNDDGINI